MAHLAADGKAEFDHIYDQPDPREYYRTLGALDYEIPQQAVPTFERIVDKLDTSQATVLDVCCSYGVNAALMRCDVHLDDLMARYRDESLDELDPARLIQLDRQYYNDVMQAEPPRVLGLDVAGNAVEYAKEVGLLDDGWAENLEAHEPSPELVKGIQDVDLITITGGIGYVTERTVDRLLSVFDDDAKPTVAAFVLRRYSYDGIAATLSKHGLQTQKQEGRTYPQRRFASLQEQDATLQALDSLGVDPTGKEADGRYHAEFYLSVPA